MKVLWASLEISAVALAVFFSTPKLATAHLLAPSMFEAEERGDDRVGFSWTAPTLAAAGTYVEPLVPPTCVPDTPPQLTRRSAAFVARWTMRCTGPGLVGQRLGAQGLASSGTQVLLRIRLADGRSLQTVLTRERPSYLVPSRGSLLDTARSYFRLGVEHIVTGFDHLAFVLGLLFLVATRRLLLWTVTSFTVGHSVTLALATLGLVQVPVAPVEAAIALSILLVAAELARAKDGPPTLLGRFPWGTAAVFGLLHGLGFAGALTQIGLPAGEIPLALLSFNVGIEVGQIVFIVVVLSIESLLATRVPWRLREAKLASAYVIGSLAAFWFFQRITIAL